MKFKYFLEQYKPILSEKSKILYGTGNAQCLFFATHKKNEKNLIVTSSDYEANKISKELEDFGIDSVVLEKKEYSFSKVYTQSKDLLIQRSVTLKNILDYKKVLIVSAPSLVQKQMSIDEYNKRKIVFHIGEEYSREEILKLLFSYGYKREYFVEKWGDFSVRGNIIDIFVSDSQYAYRIDFFGDEIEEIKYFDVNTQKSVEKVNSFSILPLTEYDPLASDFNDVSNDVLSEDKYVNEERFSGSHNSCILDYCDWNIVLIDEKNIISTMQLFYEDYMSRLSSSIEKGTALSIEEKNIFTPTYIINKLEKKQILSLNNFRFSSIFNYNHEEDFKIRPMHNYRMCQNELCNDIRLFLKNGYDIYISANKRIKEIIEILVNNNIVYSMKKNKSVTFIEDFVKDGLIDDSKKNVLITENDIFGRHSKKKKRLNFENSKKISSFYELNKDDLVVHINHGVAKYKGTKQKLFDGIVRDYIMLEYNGDDMLYIPVENIDLIQKYIGSTSNVRLSSLNSKTWQLKKQKAKKSIELISDELIELYSARQNSKGFAFSKDNSWQKEFEMSFEYELTDDQSKSVKEIKEDMQSHVPMERLLLGDVGFGKTEVAVRAIFKAVMDSKQVVFLVPTTVLAEQHYNNFIKRFESYPVKIAKLSRLTSKTDANNIIDGLNSGRIDIVVCTHIIFSPKIKFRDLGLLVVDEEQRFGVKDKEKIKKMKNNLDTLTLSATPIPRTLNISLSGIRDMSVINEPPNNRLPVETYLMEFDYEIIKFAIQREIDRGGQVFYIYNKIEDIDVVANTLSNLVPNINITYAHGRMGAKELENRMLNFVERRVDVIVCTTIIENGIDIKNANTIIIHDAQNLGLSQLYQLRGRVGRWHRTSFCYLFYPRNKVLKENAKKRLETIREFTEFGSGFKIALRDLEIRGGGSILGTTQSGHFEQIGYELYMKMLKECVDKKKNIEVQKEREVVVDIDVSAYIPSEYILNEDVKLDYYKKILDIKNLDDYFDMEDQFVEVFGVMPKEVVNLLKISLIRNYLKELPFKKIKKCEDYFKLDFDIYKELGYNVSDTIIDIFGKDIRFNFGKKPNVIIYTTDIEKIIDGLEKMIKIEKESL